MARDVRAADLVVLSVRKDGARQVGFAALQAREVGAGRLDTLEQIGERVTDEGLGIAVALLVVVAGPALDPIGLVLTELHVDALTAGHHVRAGERVGGIGRRCEVVEQDAPPRRDAELVRHVRERP